MLQSSSLFNVCREPRYSLLVSGSQRRIPAVSAACNCFRERSARRQPCIVITVAGAAPDQQRAHVSSEGQRPTDLCWMTGSMHLAALALCRGSPATPNAARTISVSLRRVKHHPAQSPRPCRAVRAIFPDRHLFSVTLLRAHLLSSRTTDGGCRFRALGDSSVSVCNKRRRPSLNPRARRVLRMLCGTVYTAYNQPQGRSSKASAPLTLACTVSAIHAPDDAARNRVFHATWARLRHDRQRTTPRTSGADRMSSYSTNSILTQNIRLQAPSEGGAVATDRALSAVKRGRKRYGCFAGQDVQANAGWAAACKPRSILLPDE
ncbi:unnamed protein product [Rangifer tarandus platyrhynchus]|uniref:Uncharacterized protein n=1 Tax=Rangifer tarandus platyrhynchus TaxID=3082113 RepID=A0ABN8XKX8_RANTA|nr:unnamed protein product [Rangifer tarandus platyrhynchus]